MNAIHSPAPQPDHDLDWEAALAAAAPAAAPAAEPAINAHVFEHFAPPANSEAVHNDIDFILDIPVQLTVELGRSKIAVRNLLQIAQGSVLELDGLAGAPMDVLINGCLIAQGEVVVVNDKFGIRLTDITNPSERIRSLKR
ncbi:flagellar motor switch protein FliN [Rugamonas sp.]|uniref:flagellar motor switch protein FliN n=1 Tax=Rugamonas sp. TaxID=1926287 RepID=UPI0025CB7B62|nr:flagellar motor switch protein FliN [Rugamonas sp.]